MGTTDWTTNGIHHDSPAVARFAPHDNKTALFGRCPDHCTEHNVRAKCALQPPCAGKVVSEVSIFAHVGHA